MPQQHEQRELAAILALDMVAYSRLMEADERETIARHKSHFSDLIAPTISTHQGRIVKTMGDGLLVVFASAVDAVECAVAIQRAMPEREVGASPDQLIQYRIGINLGDIVIDGDDILGDGVNVAAQIEAIADVGGVCLSGTTFDQLKQTVDVGYEFLDDVGQYVEAIGLVQGIGDELTAQAFRQAVQQLNFLLGLQGVDNFDRVLAQKAEILLCFLRLGQRPTADFLNHFRVAFQQAHEMIAEAVAKFLDPCRQLLATRHRFDRPFPERAEHGGVLDF
ncbi:MAG: adenylate/guanylate cyclase domain-containing protein [Rhodospirillaceae bacterium]|nr:adenylate/guanylate cyclase domain-containing protein [Rhodospirillaceae bacterium]